LIKKKPRELKKMWEIHGENSEENGGSFTCLIFCSYDLSNACVSYKRIPV
jgi:hypothetical protein